MTVEAATEVANAAIEKEFEQRRNGSPRVSILKEPLTYQARLVRGRQGDPSGMRAVTVGKGSYVQDMVRFARSGDESAKRRLDRHSKEMRVLGEERERIFSPDVAYEFEQRAVNWTNGTGGYFAPPLWIIEQFATVPTPERVLAADVPQFELPLGAASVNLPRWTAGAEAAPQQVGATGVSTDLVDSDAASGVVTIEGSADVPLQMLEQSPQGAHLDWAVFTNMEARYGYQLELQMINGTGSATPQGSGNNQILGILNNSNVPAANKVTYTDATPTVAEIIQTSGQGGPAPQAIAAVGNQRLLPPEIWLMRTSRAAWINSGEVSMFPMAASNTTGAGQFDFLSYPVKPNDAIPVNLGAGLNQDTMIICRPSDWILLESDRRTTVMTDVLSGTLSVRIQMRRYAAAILRQPTSVAYLQGSGMIVQTNF